ncbi:MAG: PepSY-associated TM helix domain-containing protein [Bryobacteraceae bacterium]|nr:PepSY-associated TM helix domain-containing protein [Bryobacteraceae bacterium]
MTETEPIAAANLKAPRSRRSFWIRQITVWHWVSSGVCLGGMLLFTITGITLNHAAEIPAVPVVQQQRAVAPAAVLAPVKAFKSEGKRPLPRELSAWLEKVFETPAGGEAEWSEAEIYVSLPRPGGDAWITVNRASGEARFEKTDRGWISYLNDLHKGRHTGLGWRIFIDVLAIACLVFSLTGLVLLQVHSAKRPATWPLVTLGAIAPVLVLLLFVHR